MPPTPTPPVSPVLRKATTLKSLLKRNERTKTDLDALEAGTSAYDQPRKKLTVRETPPGYSSLAAFIDINEDAAIFRRFGVLRARVLLTRQAVLEAKERKLELIDRKEHEMADENLSFEYKNRAFLREKDSERLKLINEISELLQLYDRDLFHYRKILGIPKPQERQVLDFSRWLRLRGPLEEQESHFLDDRDDLVALRHEPDDSVSLPEPIMEACRTIFSCCNFMFRAKSRDKMVDDPNYMAFSKPRKIMFFRFLFSLLIAGVVTAGVIVLYFVNEDHQRLIALCIATALCSVLTALLTSATKGEIVGAVAAYCAVLVVFVGSTLSHDKIPMKRGGP